MLCKSLFPFLCLQQHFFLPNVVSFININSRAISFIFDVGKDSRKPELFKVIDGDVLRQNNVSAPHTAHCLANGNIMISTMGDAAGNASGDFVLFDQNFEVPAIL